MKTQKHLRTETHASPSTAAGHDPWQEPAEDPWNTWKLTTGSAAATKLGPGKSHLAEMTGQLRDQLQASMRKDLEEYKLHKDTMQVDGPNQATEERFQKIENTMGEIQAQQQQFNQWFTGPSF